MPQSLALVLVHVVFSTKGREPFLKSPELRSSMHAYLTGTSKNLQCEPLQVGGTEDHIHILSGLSRIISIAELVKNLKTSSSRNFRNKGQSTFAWQTGYGAFSVSQSSKANVIAYIANQETHHRKVTFQEEFRSFRTKHGVRFDERYVWN